MFRWIKAIIYKFTGFFADAAEGLQEDKHVMAATFDKSIAMSADRFTTVREAVANYIGIQKKKQAKLKSITEDIDKYSRIMKAAGGKAKEISARLKKEGVPPGEILNHVDVIHHKENYKAAKRDLANAESKVAELETEIEENENHIATYKAELTQMQRSHEALKEEKNEAIADVAISKQLDSINSALTGISDNSADNDLAAAREARNRAKARSEITAELAGTDARRAENDYLEYEATMDTDDEFADLLDLGDEPEVEAPEKSAELPD